MPAKKIPTKTGNESVVEDIVVGYFEIEGELEMIEINHTFRHNTRHRSHTIIPILSVRLGEPRVRQSVTLNLPIEFQDKISLGKTYDIRCTIIEKKGNNEDV